MPSPRFLGTYSATLDGEGRLQLPAALRDEINVRSPEFRLMATFEADGSLCLRQKEHFDAWIDALQARPVRDQRARTTLHAVAAFSSPVKCDKQGRIRVPDALLALVGLDRSRPAAREVVLAGGLSELRLWSPSAWASFAESARESLGAGLDALLGGGSPFESPAEVSMGDETRS